MSEKPLTMHPFESAIVRTLEADNARLTEENERLRAALQRVFTEVDLDAMDDNAELQRQLSTIARLARAALSPPQEPRT